jgi:hypothetical protein
VAGLAHASVVRPDCATCSSAPAVRDGSLECRCAMSEARVMTVVNAPRRISLAVDLERRRLEHRAARLEAVMRELRARARNHAAPQLLGRAIEGFDVELDAVRRRLAATRSVGSSAGARAPRGTTMTGHAAERMTLADTEPSSTPRTVP